MGNISAYVLLDVNLIIGDGSDPMPGAYLRVDGHEIAEVGSMSDYLKRPDVTEIDLNGYTIMPGLIDAHIHLSGGRGYGNDADTEIMCEPNIVRAMRSVADAQAMLKHGFTALRDISWNGLYLKRIFGEDVLPGPRVIACGPGLARTGGHCDSYFFTREYNQDHHQWAILSEGIDECRKNVRRVLREGADQIKFWASGGGNWPTDRITDTHYSFEEMKVIVEEAHMIEGTMVCAHAESFDSIKKCIDAGIDTLEHGESLNEEYAEKMAARGIILVPTLAMVANWYIDIEPVGSEYMPLRPFAFLHRTKDEKVTQAYADTYRKNVMGSFNLAREKGVKIAMGSDAVYEPATEYGPYSQWEIHQLSCAGLSALEVIEAATATAAEALGMRHRIGTLTTGKNADILVLKKDPAEDIEVLCDKENISEVILNGRFTIKDGTLLW
jgi:imidazolonepropionase-like amidohydrolase